MHGVVDDRFKREKDRAAIRCACFRMRHLGWFRNAGLLEMPRK